MKVLLSLRSDALALTLSGLAGGESLPLPGSKGRAFLLPLDGCPTASANVAQGQEDLLKKLRNLLFARRSEYDALVELGACSEF